jgi:hypothetical protein
MKAITRSRIMRVKDMDDIGVHPMTWDEFRNLVDRVIMRKVGVGIDDLPDTVVLDDYWSEDHLLKSNWIARAKEAAAEVLDYAGYDEEGMDE